ncbi:MAG: imidazole glycerol phosphate synthase subunit HisH [Anaerovoracaceae bacterium]
MVSIVDYEVGNLFSLVSSLKFIGAEAIVTSNPDEIIKSDKIILPGVGAFADAARKLRQSGLDKIVKSQAAAGKDILGICLGMQMLFEKSYEYGEHEGLGLIKGQVVPMEGRIGDGLKIPHIGWNELHFQKDCKLFKYLNEGECVYFVHSFYADNCQKNVVATAEYGIELTAAVAGKNIYGCQFHPEKSGETGLKILKAFCDL